MCKRLKSLLDDAGLGVEAQDDRPHNLADIEIRGRWLGVGVPGQGCDAAIKVNGALETVSANATLSSRNRKLAGFRFQVGIP